MCDRVCLFSTNPGKIVSEIPIPLRQPRDRNDPAFSALVERIYVEMTARRADRAAQRGERATMGTILHRVSANTISGLLEAVAAQPFNGEAGLPEIADETQFEIDELFPVAEALQLLRLADIEGGDIKLTETGKRFATEDIDERKRIFARLLIRYVPLAAHIRRVLDERESHTASWNRFLDELEDYMTEDAADETLSTVVSWARFAELFSYDDDSQMFSLENPT